MAVVGILSLVVCVLGLAAYVALSGVSRASFVEVARIAFAMGLLAFLLGAGAQSCTLGTSPPARAARP